MQAAEGDSRAVLTSLKGVTLNVAFRAMEGLMAMPMSTWDTNQLTLTPLSGVVHARLFAARISQGVELGHSRSRPAERDTTYRPGFVKPVAPIEKPVVSPPTVLPLEPAREPVPGAIPA